MFAVTLLTLCPSCRAFLQGFGKKASFLFQPVLSNFTGKSRKSVKILQMDLTLQEQCLDFIRTISLPARALATERLCFPPFFLLSFPPSFSICTLSAGQKREVRVMYGDNPLCATQKINLNELIYYLWQVFCTQICQSECALISHTCPGACGIVIVK